MFLIKGFGAVLEQEGPKGRRPFAFNFLKLNMPVKRYAIHDFELLAIADTLHSWSF